jgi:hypothetical protein
MRRFLATKSPVLRYSCDVTSFIGLLAAGGTKLTAASFREPRGSRPSWPYPMRSPPAFGAKTGGLFENRPFLLRYHFAMNAKHERNSGMPRKAADFFISIVRPTVEEFLRDTGDLRRGFLATIVLYHTADYWFRENKIKYNDDLSSLHGDLIKNRPEFTVIRDVADASKHGELLRPQKKNRRNLSSSDQVNVINDFFSDGVSIFFYVPDVKYTLDDGSSGSLEGAVRSVLSMWETILVPLPVGQNETPPT